MRRIGPLHADHLPPPCPACQEPFVAGDHAAMVPLGPGNYAESRQRCREGRPYNAIAVVCHYACVTGFEE